jgi:hypothetical protein
LAQWIANDKHPLTARVMVNRIWQHHFGRGIVATSGNFGRIGSPPTNPQLLDWLAKAFIESDWSIKAMHRLILLSNTYQQAYVDNPLAAASDPENNLLWRMRRRRLSAEEVRDAVLAVSGQLDLTMGGTLFTEGYSPVDANRELYTIDISGKDVFAPFEHPRRSIYLPVIRNSRPEALRLFDVANEHEPSSIRGETTVSTQALFLTNSAFVRRMAEKFAERVLAEASGDPKQAPTAEQIVTRAYQFSLGREPTDVEIRRTLDFVDAYVLRVREADLTSIGPSPKRAQTSGAVVHGVIGREQFLAWQAVCQALFCLNEFMYVD